MPSSKDKRARKKSARDAAIAAQWAQYRRRRNVRIAGVAIVLGAVVIAAILVNDDEKPSDDQAGGRPSPSSAAACGAEPPPPADPQQYDEPPDLALPEGVDYAMVIETSCGDLEVDLLEEKAPKSVANFVFLAQEGFFDGLIWHRVEQNSVIQSGDPDGQNGQEPDGPGYAIPDELPEQDREYVYGVLGMANSGPDTGGSQFFIVVHDIEGMRAGTPEPAGYDAAYSIFGEVAESSWEVLEEIARQPVVGGQDPTEAVKPITPIYINAIQIIER